MMLVIADCSSLVVCLRTSLGLINEYEFQRRLAENRLFAIFSLFSKSFSTAYVSGSPSLFQMIRNASMSSRCSLQYFSKASVVSFASSMENPLLIRVSSPGISISTKPALRISRYWRASGWLIIPPTKPLRSLFGWLMSSNGGNNCWSRAVKMADASSFMSIVASSVNLLRCSSLHLL